MLLGCRLRHFLKNEKTLYHKTLISKPFSVKDFIILRLIFTHARKRKT